MNDCNITLRTSIREDGGEHRNYSTQDVLRDGVMIGAIQCSGPCYGEFARHRPGRHGPWIAFTGATIGECRNLAGRHADVDAAIAAILEDIR